MTTATFYIITAFCWLVTCGVAYALGWAEGRRQGEIDGYEEAAGECRRRCAR